MGPLRYIITIITYSIFMILRNKGRLYRCVSDILAYSPIQACVTLIIIYHSIQKVCHLCKYLFSNTNMYHLFKY